MYKKKKECLTICHNYRWSFEWKRDSIIGDACEPLFYSDIYGILQDAVNCIWSDEWRVGASSLVEYMLWDTNPIKTRISCEDGGTVTTKAGTFDHCLMLTLDIEGLDDGIAYRGGMKRYYFADGIGIVRTENKYCCGAKTAVYELTVFQGTGEGYMPLADGMTRRYEALDLTDGFVGGVEYTYAKDEEGQIVIFEDRTGIREIPTPVTRYGAIQGEIIEDQLWEQGKHAESRLRHDINNFHLLVHFLGRLPRYWGVPEKAAAWNKYRMQTLEGLGEGKEVPAAWLGFYSGTCFRTACAQFGCGKKEEGYEYLERTYKLFSKWNSIPDGEEMDTGNPWIFGGIKVLKGKGLIILPDNTKEPISYDELHLQEFFGDNSSLMYHGMTAPHGWEWFDCVRSEDRFQKYIECAQELMHRFSHAVN